MSNTSFLSFMSSLSFINSKKAHPGLNVNRQLLSMNSRSSQSSITSNFLKQSGATGAGFDLRLLLASVRPALSYCVCTINACMHDDTLFSNYFIQDKTILCQWPETYSLTLDKYPVFRKAWLLDSFIWCSNLVTCSFSGVQFSSFL